MNSLMSSTKEKAPINWHFTCQLNCIYENFKSNILEAYKVQADCLKDSESDFYDKNGMEEKVNDLFRLYEAMQEKLKTASYSEQSKFLPWHLINGLEYAVQNILMSLNALFEIPMKSKSRRNISKTCS